MKLLLAGGGTGGHLFPGVAVAQRLLEVSPDAQVLFVGTERGIEAKVLPKLQLPLRTIDISGFVGKGWKGKVALLPQLVRSLNQSRKILEDFQPDVVMGLGGYASAPVLLAALLGRYPTLIHEQNAWPGLTNRLLARWVDRVCLSFTEADRAFHWGRTVPTGNPVRRGLEECAPIAEGKPHLLIFGGSRGARAINEVVVKTLPLLEELRDRLTILHQAGEEDVEKVQEGYRQAGWEGAVVVPFIDDMSGAYRQAHLVLCRAGATSIAELTACGRPAILVPYPFAAGDHQTANAQALVSKGAAFHLPQRELTPERLARLLTDMLRDDDLLRSMAASSASLGRRGAADAILKECRVIARKGK